MTAVAAIPVPVQNVQPRRHYAGFWRRAAATLIDAAIVAAMVIPTAIVISWIMEGAHEFLRMKVHHARYLAGIGAVASWVIGDWLYHATQWSRRQATVGKRCLRLRVISRAGSTPSFPQATTRHFAKFLSVSSVLGVIMIAYTRRKQALHDIVADTFVVQY